MKWKVSVLIGILQAQFPGAAVLGTGSESTVGKHSCRLSSDKGREEKSEEGKGEEKRRKRATEAGQRGEAAFKRKPRRIRSTS
ncbi:hypothetical protein LEMLEM_LOCUS24041 [Lemmus lemmus]